MAAGKVASRLALPLILLALPLLGGCGRGPGVVPVQGKITLRGGNWPSEGFVVFSPIQAAEGQPLVPGMARLEMDGSFAAKTGEHNGLMPGEYLVAITCWERAPTDAQGGKSAIPARYGDPSKSGLKVSVPMGSPRIVVNWDVSVK